MSTSATPETPKFERIRDGIKKLPVTEREWDYAFTYDKELNGRLTQHMDRNLAIRDAFIGRLNEIIDAVNGLATLTQRALGAKANGDAPIDEKRVRELMDAAIREAAKLDAETDARHPRELSDEQVDDIVGRVVRRLDAANAKSKRGK